LLCKDWLKTQKALRCSLAYAAIWNKLATKFASPIESLLANLFTYPFLIRCIASNTFEHSFSRVKGAETLHRSPLSANEAVVLLDDISEVRSQFYFYLKEMEFRYNNREAPNLQALIKKVVRKHQAVPDKLLKVYLLRPSRACLRP
jgi:hypothetical protein